MKWFFERVLPGLVAALIAAVVGYAFGAATWINQKVVFGAFPDGSILLSSQIHTQCPDGFRRIGSFGVDMDTDARSDQLNYVSKAETPVSGVEFVYPIACYKGGL